MRPPKPFERTLMWGGGWLFGRFLCHLCEAWDAWRLEKAQLAETERLEAVWERLGSQREKPLLS